MNTEVIGATLALVVAVAENGVIGAKGGLPWKLSTDLKFFRKVTLGKPIIMGRKTFASIGRPLDGRDNIVITRDGQFKADGATVCQSMTDALQAAEAFAAASGADEIMVIGGAEIYRLALPQARRIYLTTVHTAPEGDAMFEPLDPTSWFQTSEQAVPAGERDDHAMTFRVYERI